MSKQSEEKDWSKFIELLGEQYSFPCKYLFKFVVAVEHQETLAGLLEEAELNFRLSSNGKYVSISCHYHAEAPTDIVIVYEKVKVIPGLITL